MRSSRRRRPPRPTRKRTRTKLVSTLIGKGKFCFGLKLFNGTNSLFLRLGYVLKEQSSRFPILIFTLTICIRPFWSNVPRKKPIGSIMDFDFLTNLCHFQKFGCRTSPTATSSRPETPTESDGSSTAAATAEDSAATPEATKSQADPAKKKYERSD